MIQYERGTVMLSRLFVVFLYLGVTINNTWFTQDGWRSFWESWGSRLTASDVFTEAAEIDCKNHIRTDISDASLIPASVYDRLRRNNFSLPYEIYTESYPFPEGIPVSKQSFKNFAGDIRVKNIWTAEPRTPEDVVVLANWASNNGYKLRPKGYMHTWSPITITPDASACEKLILIDTTKYLTKMTMESNVYAAAVTVQSGASLTNLLTFLESNGFGIMSHPAVGEITVGGMLAIGAHGTGINIQGQSYGSISNLVVSLNAVVWNATVGEFEIRTFHRRDPITKALLVNLGRIFISEVTLRVTRSRNMECISRSDIPDTELFANPSEAAPSTRTISNFLDKYGGLEAIWAPFTTDPWLRTWTIKPKRPKSARYVGAPYNYPVTHSFPMFTDALKKFIFWSWEFHTTLIAKLIRLGSLTSHAHLWGPSKNVLLYVNPTVLRTSGLGYVVITNRTNIQLIVSQVTTFYDELLKSYAASGLFPVNLGIEVRVTAIDNPDVVGITNAEAPSLSPVTPVPGRSDLNTAVWFTILTFPGTQNSTQFMEKLETFLITNFPASLAVVRSEWSKGWAYTNFQGWKKGSIIRETIPSLYKDWQFAVSTFNELDPKKVFTNSFLNDLLRR